MKVLVVSNMGPKLSAPLQGEFVVKQVMRLKETALDISYFGLHWNGDNFIHKLLKYPVFFIRFFFTHIVAKKQNDIIHIHYYFPTIICAALYKVFRNRKVKIIVTCHGSDIYYYTPPNWLYKKLSFIVDHWFFTSEKLYRRFYRPLANKSILCAGYDDHVFTNKHENLAKNIDCLFIGSLDINKGVDRLKWLAEQLPNVNFTIVGNGPLEQELRDFSVHHKNFVMKGQQTPLALAQLLKQSKLLLSLSRNESFGLVMTEAHACKTPCVVTATDGSLAQLEGWPYITHQDENELITLENLKNNIMDILQLDNDTYQSVRNLAHAKSIKYSLSYVVDEINQVYIKQGLDSSSNI